MPGAGRVAGYRGAMSTENRRAPGTDPEDGGAPPGMPQLDADGMPVDDPSLHPAPARLSGPSPLLPALVAAIGTALTVLAVLEVIRASSGEGGAPPMVPAVLAASLALGGYSLTRMLQLWALAGSRTRRRAAGEELAPVRWMLPDAHSLHAIWVIGVGGSIALMGLLGIWSLLEGEPSGLEPGVPLLLLGGGVALLAHQLRLRTTRRWELAGDLD